MAILRDATINGTLSVTGEIVAGGVETSKVSTKTLSVDESITFNGTYIYGAIYGLGRLTRIPSGDDFNNYTTPGMYAVYSTSNVVENSPIRTAGILKVYCSTGDGTLSGKWVYIKQEFYPFGDFSKYGRTITSGDSTTLTYGSWQKIY